MSDVLGDLAVLDAAIAHQAEQLTKDLVQEQDAAMMKGSIARAAILVGAEALPMAQCEELLAEAMANATHVYMETLSKAQQDVALLRLDIGDRWPDPDVMDSWAFIVSEVAEVGDALLRKGYGNRDDYCRNNSKQVDVVAELGDVYLMLCTLATCLGVDLDSALQGRIDKLRRKHGD